MSTSGLLAARKARGFIKYTAYLNPRCGWNYVESATQRDARPIHTYGSTRKRRTEPKKVAKMQSREGLSISKSQITRLWNLFDIGDDNKINFQEFTQKFPNINKNLTMEYAPSDKNCTDSSQLRSNISTISSLSDDPTQEDYEGEASEEIFNPIAQEAEQKLQRMLSKIDNREASDLPSDVQNTIRILISEELETVLDLWMKISHTDECETLQQAVEATDRAMNLLLQFQTLNESGIKVIPPIHCFQSVIDNYYILFKNNEASLTIKDIEHFQTQNKGLLKGIVKQALTLRMYALERNESQSFSAEKSKTKLNETYNKVISMFLTEQITNQPMTASYSEARLQAIATEMANEGSKLLQEMELFYHDFHTNEISIENKDLQNFLVTIHPSEESFKMIISTFTYLAQHYGCSFSIQRAVDILERCWKRYVAYENSEDSNMMEIVKPNVELYETVLKCYSNMEVKNINTEKIQLLVQEASLENLPTIKPLLDKICNGPSDLSL